MFFNSEIYFYNNYGCHAVETECEIFSNDDVDAVNIVMMMMMMMIIHTDASRAMVG